MNRTMLENMTHTEFCRYIEMKYDVRLTNKPTMRNMILDLIEHYENMIASLENQIDAETAY